MLNKGGNPFVLNRQGESVSSLIDSQSPVEGEEEIIDQIKSKIEALKKIQVLDSNESPTHRVVRQNKVCKLKLFKILGASLNSFNLKGQTPRDVAIEKGFFEIIDFFR